MHRKSQNWQHVVFTLRHNVFQPDLARPDLVIFDLEPGDEANYSDVLQAALSLREALELMGLRVRAYAKTSDGRGLHVCLSYPIAEISQVAQVARRARI